MYVGGVYGAVDVAAYEFAVSAARQNPVVVARRFILFIFVGL